MPAIEIKATDVQKLRQMTGAGLMDCKKALTEAGGNFEKAIQYLREQGIAKSSQRADRVAGEGLIDAWVSDSGQEGIMIELNCESDFVARNQDFVQMGKTLLKKIGSNPGLTEVSQIPMEPLVELSAKTGEKIEFPRFVRYRIKGEGLVGVYIHPGSKLGVMIEIQTSKNMSASGDFKNLVKELALQIAGANPLYVTQKDVPADVLQKEKEIAKKQMEGQNKPPEVLEKIATGKLRQFFEANCLLDQPHVRDASGKTKVQDLIDNLAKKEKIEIKVIRFDRYRVGGA